MNQGRYLAWLKKQICAGKGMPYRKYNKLLERLFNIEFRWDYVGVPTDANRADDGLQLRLLYLHESGDTMDFRMENFPCTLLEMMVALAIRIENDVMGEPGDNHPERWFWQMVDNLELLGQTDSAYDDIYVSKVLGKLIGRMYSKNGRGSLFPLRHVSMDQRDLAIWDQAAAYLIENY